MLGASSSPPSSWRNPPQSEEVDEQHHHQQQQHKGHEEHPMIPVPQALRTVLQQTASNIIQQRSNTSSNSHCEVLSLSNPTNVFGRISFETLYAPEPGYPPYHASIMDGYAINTNDIQNANFLSDNSTMKRFQIVNRVHAGDNSTAAPKPTTTATTDLSMLQNDNLPKAIYVTTGAAIPYPTYNTVIPIELVNEYNISNQVIAIDRKVLIDAQLDKWIRKIGCDIPSKEVIVQSGSSIEAVHIGLLLQCGYTQIKVQSLPIVGILSTGNEIMSIDEMNKQGYYQTGYQNNHIGMIPDANGPVLSSLLTSYQNCHIKNYGIVNDDDVDNLTSTLSKAIQECNVIITSGGVSMGEKDIIENVLCDKLGCQIHFGRLHMKPGKPTTFATYEKVTEDGREDKCFIFAMPGNPVSAFVCTDLLVRPCLDMLHSTVVVDNTMSTTTTTTMNEEAESKERDEKVVGGEVHHSENVLTMVQNASVHAEIHATLTNRVKLDVERPEYLRVKLSTRVVFDQNGYESFLFEATSTGVQRSSRLMSMCDADGLMMLPQGIQGVKLFAEEGESYPVLLLRRPGGTFIKDGFLNTIKLKDSLHYQTSSLTVGIVNIIGHNASFYENDDFLDENMTSKIGDEYADDVQSRIMYALDDDSIFFLQNLKVSGGDSISNVIRSKMSNCLDIIFVVCSQTSFQMNLEVSYELRRFVTKDAQALSLQARRNAAQSQPLAALFDPVAGYCDIDGKSCLLLSLSEDGLENALYSVRNLLKRAVSIVGGKQVIY